MSWILEIHIEEPFQDQVQDGWVRQAAEMTLVFEGIDYPAELSLLVTGDQTVRELNRTYRGVDETTDVLAFAPGAEDSSFHLPPDGVTHLGEAIISCPQAARQAEEQKHSLKREFAILTIHGILHLLGYDHQQPGEEQAMIVREAEILARLS
ncbi:rRNA maturation RNase YbeY [Dehalococcoidia bacterium]|nr:rRNA maturation RNase YbeY [Dehalococcoidia bacterium]